MVKIFQLTLVSLVIIIARVKSNSVRISVKNLNGKQISRYFTSNPISINLCRLTPRLSLGICLIEMQTTETLECTIRFAEKHLGTPYIYGGNTRWSGIDCSGFTQEIQWFAGINPSYDQSAQMQYDRNSKQNWRSMLGKGAFIYYGKTRNGIYHVAFAISDKEIIEAGGGDSSTTSIQEAVRRNAKVRIMPITHRQREIVAVLMPNWVN